MMRTKRLGLRNYGGSSGSFSDNWKITQNDQHFTTETGGSDQEFYFKFTVTGRVRQEKLNPHPTLPRALIDQSINQSINQSIIHSLWSPYGIRQTIIVSSCGFFLLSIFFFFPSPNLSGRTLDVYHTWCGPSANLKCRSEICCTRLAENAGPKKSPKIGHLGTIAQLCRAIPSLLRHVSTIDKIVRWCV